MPPTGRRRTAATLRPDARPHARFAALPIVRRLLLGYQAPAGVNVPWMSRLSRIAIVRIADLELVPRGALPMRRDLSGARRDRLASGEDLPQEDRLTGRLNPT